MHLRTFQKKPSSTFICDFSKWVIQILVVCLASQSRSGGSSNGFRRSLSKVRTWNAKDGPSRSNRESSSVSCCSCLRSRAAIFMQYRRASEAASLACAFGARLSRSVFENANLTLHAGFHMGVKIGALVWAVP